ncbi:hypothetical protein KSP40_PGU010723 [Platanthera guangdongensis]|uniref:Uncharacterized protein n=1 Tax=Platanthera guangdongensis TaxID=2320717 RepID=A0ABR2N4X0_9ASPA
MMMMLSSRRPEAHQKPLQISNDDKFFTRILSKEISASTPSFRIYYGVSAAGAVPFHWESQPGTPKHATSATTLPPLTPPPSYHFISPKNKPSASNSPKTKLNRIHSILPWLAAPPKKPQSPSPSQRSSSSAASPASSRSHRRGVCHFSSPVSSFSSNSKSCDEGFDEGLSASSTLSLRRRRHPGGKTGCYFMFVMKNVLLCIVGQRSAC